MAHHLVRRHPPPTTDTLGMHPSQPVKDLGLVALPGQSLHFATPAPLPSRTLRRRATRDREWDRGADRATRANDASRQESRDQWGGAHSHSSPAFQPPIGGPGGGSGGAPGGADPAGGGAAGRDR